MREKQAELQKMVHTNETGKNHSGIKTVKLTAEIAEGIVLVLDGDREAASKDSRNRHKEKHAIVAHEEICKSENGQGKQWLNIGGQKSGDWVR